MLDSDNQLVAICSACAEPISRVHLDRKGLFFSQVYVDAINTKLAGKNANEFSVPNDPCPIQDFPKHFVLFYTFQSRASSSVCLHGAFRSSI